jgi:hypothetical protein
MLGREQLSNDEVSSEHKHLWAATGCWCGATRGTFQIPREASDFTPRKVIPYRGSRPAVKADQCEQAAVSGKKFCAMHPLKSGEERIHDHA